VHNPVGASSLGRENVGEAGPNPRLAAMGRAVDAAVRERLKEVIGAIYPDAARADDRELEAKIELMLAIFDGLTVRVVRNPEFDRAGVVRDVQKIVREMFGE